MPAVTATNGFFKGTAIAALNRSLHVIAWTWLLNSPRTQVAMAPRQHEGGWVVPVGAADDAFAPPWSAHAIDARLLNLDGRHLLATFVPSCHARQPCHFGVSQVQLTGETTPDGSLARMRAWAHPTFTSTHAWVRSTAEARRTAQVTNV